MSSPGSLPVAVTLVRMTSPTLARSMPSPPLSMASTLVRASVGRDLPTLTLTNVEAIDNGGDGIDLANVGDVILTNVTATGNDPGLLINGAASVSDTDGDYSNNLEG